MNKSILTFFALLSLSPFLVQCASQDDVKTLSYQLRAVNKKLEDMQTTTVGEMQKKQASSSGQITELQQEILALKGELESTSVTNRQLQEHNKKLEASLQGIVSKQSSETDVKISQLNEQLKVQQDSVTTLHEARAQEAERKAKVAAEAAEAAKSKIKGTAAGTAGVALYQADRKKTVKGQTPAAVAAKDATASRELGTAGSTKPAATASASIPPASDAETVPAPDDAAASTPPATPKKEQSAPSPGNELFNQAQKKYDAGNYQSAYETFEASIEKDSNSPNAVQARYMMGESLYQQKEYDQAILQYQKIIASQPKHAKTPAALLKQGMAFELLADKDTAKMIYQKIISSYGSSPEAAQAKAKLSAL